jgi:hypothetical protein
MIITAWLTDYDDKLGKKYKIIDGGDYDGMYCVNVNTSGDLYQGRIKIYLQLINTTKWTNDHGAHLDNESFWSGINIIDIQYEETKTNLEYRG